MNHESLRFELHEHAALVYHVLSHLGLEADAASTFDASLGPRPWTGALRDAYLGAHGRLAVQVLALAVDDDRELTRALTRAAPEALADEAGRRLAQGLLDAMEAERGAFTTRWRARERTAAKRHGQLASRIGEPLTAVRAALWEQSPSAAPPLRIWDCPALGPHGRATSRKRERVVAVSLDMSADHVLCQVLHEETHPITDPVVLGQDTDMTRDTRAGAPGFVLHHELELAAVETTRAAIEARAPELVPAYRAWCARFGMGEG